MAIATLFHDLCKTKIYRKTERWRKNAEGRWESYSGYEIQDEFPFGHGEKSCIILGWFLRLKQDELLAIRWHMGMFEMGEQGSNTRFAFRSSLERSPLVVVLHTADMLSANLLEKHRNKRGQKFLLPSRSVDNYAFIPEGNFSNLSSNSKRQKTRASCVSFAVCFVCRFSW